MSEAIAMPQARAPEDGGLIEFRFIGSGGEYFRIWIVNLFLTIVSMGIYSAWAKVRRLRYFYGCTRLDGTPFQYTGDPVAILKGRVLVWCVLLVYGLVGHFMPALQMVAGLLFAGLMPWLIVMALRFTARNSMFLGLRFNFTGGYGGALRAFVLWFLLLPFTLGTIYPYIVFRQKAFVVNNHLFGATPFVLSATVRQFYGVYLAALGVLLLFVVAAVSFASLAGQGETPGPGKWLSVMVFIVLAYAALLVVYAYVRAGVTNLVLNHTTLGPHRFESRLEYGRLLWIYLSNLALVILSIGLFIPWARVRTVRYQAACTRMVVAGSLGDFIAAQSEAAGAAGGEFADAMDLDLSL